jgi:hypothetical protein
MDNFLEMPADYKTASVTASELSDIELSTVAGGAAGAGAGTSFCNVKVLPDDASLVHHG